MRKDRLKKWGGLLLSLCLLAGFAPPAAAAAEAWDGAAAAQPETDENGVYQISTGAELAWFAQQVNAGQNDINAVLTQDIDLDGHPWTPIGVSDKMPYSGIFNGDGHVIENLSVNGSSSNYYNGLFGKINKAAEQKSNVENLTVEGSVGYTGNPGFNSGRAGGIAGCCAGKITHCISRTEVAGNGVWSGGIVGELNGGAVENCTNEGMVHVTQNQTYTAGVGGIVGYANTPGNTISSCVNLGAVSNEGTGIATGGVIGYGRASVSDSCNMAAVSAKGKSVGGVVGTLQSGGVIEKVYNRGSVTGSDNVGGVVGEISGSANSVKWAYSTGEIKGGSQTGGIAGTGKLEKVEKCCYFLKTETINAGLEAVGGKTGGSGGTVCGKTEAEMKGAEVLAALNAGLDPAAFVADDGGVNGGFPIFSWQAVPREPEPPTLLIDGNPAESGRVLAPGTHTVSVTWRNRRAGTLLLLGVYREEALLTCVLAPAGEDTVSLTQELAAGTAVRAFFWDSALTPQESPMNVEISE